MIVRIQENWQAADGTGRWCSVVGVGAASLTFSAVPSAVTMTVTTALSLLGNWLVQ